MGVVHQEEIRKGPWTEQEDFQLVCFVGLFGDRRWDFIAKVSGLNRTGKSCRLRWVNYLHPGLKRGKMTPQEERLVLELHAKWGNRWSRIARKLPGRTDNEIKNYWRTHMRKKAQEKKRANNNNNNNNNNNSSSSSPSPPSPSLSSSSNSIKSSSSSSKITTVESLPFPDSTTGVESFYDTGGRVVSAPIKEKKKADHDQEEKEQEAEEEKGYYSMDEIWKEISLPEVNNIMNNIDQVPFGNDNNIINNDNNSINFSIPDPLITTSSSSAWDDHHHEYYSDSLWKMVDEEASKAFFPTTANDQFFSCFGYELGSL